MAEFMQGDRVEWSSHGSTARGEVKRKITSDTQAAGRTVRASELEDMTWTHSLRNWGHDPLK